MAIARRAAVRFISSLQAWLSRDSFTSLVSSMRLATSRHGQGFAYGFVDGNDWKVWLAHRVGDNWVWQSDLNIWSPKK